MTTEGEISPAIVATCHHHHHCTGRCGYHLCQLAPSFGTTKDRHHHHHDSVHYPHDDISRQALAKPLQRLSSMSTPNHDDPSTRRPGEEGYDDDSNLLTTESDSESISDSSTLSCFWSDDSFELPFSPSAPADGSQKVVTCPLCEVCRSVALSVSTRRSHRSLSADGPTGQPGHQTSRLVGCVARCPPC